jgi:hypothetical protein
MYRAFHNDPFITNILTKRTQETYLNGIVHSHRKAEIVFLTTRGVGYVYHG